MFLKAFILYCCLFHLSAEQSTSNEAKCLLGDMTDMQEWVDEEGSLHPSTDDIENSIDVSTVENPVPILNHRISLFRTTRYFVKYLSMARCYLNRVPLVFQLRDSQGRRLSSTVEYLTFFGNTFLGMNSLEEQYTATFNATGITEMNLSDVRSQVVHIWSAGLITEQFPKLKELDLRACSIQILSDKVFSGMPNLTALYLAGNEIFYVDSTAFIGLKNLLHLDFSRNNALDANGNRRVITSDSFLTFKYLENLVTLDMSYTKLTSRNLGMIKSLGKSLKGLSLCDSGLAFIPDSFFNTTSLELLDLSRNNGVFNSQNALKGLEDSLVTLYAKEVGLQTMDFFQNFSKLEILKLSCNEIDHIDSSMASLRNLKVLDLDRNRITSWFKSTYSLIPNLKYLSLKNNNINVITEQMITDVMQIDYLAMSGNFMVCNCHAKDFYKMAAINEHLPDKMLINTPADQLHYKGYYIYNKKINERLHAELDCDEACVKDVLPTGNFRLVDYTPDSYICLMVPESNSMLISDVTSCGMASREVNLEQELARGRNKLLALSAIPCTLLPMMLLFIFRRHIRYFFITFKNSAMLSLVHKNDTVDDSTIFNYDVFVSYCNEDRGWVLDHLLPHLEADCSISACLHERDFQVGLSILENIVSCMDRSRSIMLILSQRFLLSQWCQFEMHLAQHRLLETRREDLTLVLLEDIPRRLRPNTLHYLMLTKTYIVWPKEESDRCMFWKRIKKTLMSQKPIENVSLV